MTRLPRPDDAVRGRYPGFEVMDQAPHWDPATRDLLEERLRDPGPLRFFRDDEAGTARALFSRLLGQTEDEQVRVPVTSMVDERLAEGRTDGWSYADLPEDAEAWRRTLEALDEDARHRHGHNFEELSDSQQDALLEDIRTAGRWHSFPAPEVWSLWTRYACSAFYSHPYAWNEIGYAGPAYPRGYKNLGLDAPEPYEVEDARPAQNPTHQTRGDDRDLGRRGEAGHAGARAGDARHGAVEFQGHRPPVPDEPGDIEPSEGRS